MIWWITGGILAVVLIYAALTYNRLNGMNKRADAAWSDIDVQLKRRWDLIPTLVETVKGYVRHESDSLQNVVSARAQARQAESIDERSKNESQLADEVARLLVLVESYPDLKASGGFQNLHHSLVEVEDNLQYARRYYNAVVRDLNTLIQHFPAMIVAGFTGFRQRSYFQMENEQRQSPIVDLEHQSDPHASPP